MPSIAEIEAPGWMAGKTFVELNLRRSRGIQVLMINPSKDGQKTLSEQPQLVPQPDYSIRLVDNLIVLGPAETIRILKR